ncbi:MAG: hypothetical protein K2X55_18280, partial [Burkholderiaceae bacterium]|nr:hypothetical protein [Burkholderiaceae bacterium]
MRIHRRLNAAALLAAGIHTIAAAVAAAPEPPPPQQQPFICRTQESGLGQPLIDNQDGIGHPVRDAATGQVVGYSRQCQLAPRTEYFYFNG